MRTITRVGSLFWITLLMCGPTMGIEIAKGATGPSDGWHIPEGAAAEPNPEPLTAANLTRGQSLYKAKCQGRNRIAMAGAPASTTAEQPLVELAS